MFNSEEGAIVEAVCGFTSLRGLNMGSTVLLGGGAAGTFIQGANLCDLERLDISRAVNPDGAKYISQIDNMLCSQNLGIGNNLRPPESQNWLMQCMAGLSCLSHLGM